MTPAARSHPRNRPLIHLAIVVWVPVCALACYWQITVALAGDDLGWLYSIEWPVFGVFGLVVWWNLIHDDPESVGARAMRSRPKKASSWTGRDRAATTRTSEESPELARYNDYLASLAAARRAEGRRELEPVR